MLGEEEGESRNVGDDGELGGEIEGEGELEGVMGNGGSGSWTIC
jgi:hypothetical protein